MLNSFTAGLKTYAPSGNGYVSASNNLPWTEFNSAGQTLTSLPRWGYAYSFFLNNSSSARSVTLPLHSCNDIAIYVSTGKVSPDYLGNAVSLEYHRFPGNAIDSGCLCATLNPTIAIPSGSFRLTFLTRGATCTSYMRLGQYDAYALPTGNWVTEAGLGIDWPSLRAYLGE